MWTDQNGTLICSETQEEVSIIEIDHAEEPNTKFDYHVELYDPESDYREYLTNTHTYERALKAQIEFTKLNPNGSIIIKGGEKHD